MPRIRTIKPKFWDDIKLSKISRDARLIFIGIWNFSDDLGVIVGEPDYLKSKILPYDKLEPDQFEKWLKELVDKKFILPITYNEESFFYIRTFNRHQQINKPNHHDICIDNQELTKLIEHSVNNHGRITEEDCINTGQVQGGMERKGRDKEGISNGREGIFLPENFSLHKIYSQTFEQLKNSFKNLTEEGFLNWRKFVDFIITHDFVELFESKFITPQDFQKLDFPESKWEETIKKILATGIEQKHNLYFRIPQFLDYGTKQNTKSGGAGNRYTAKGDGGY